MDSSSGHPENFALTTPLYYVNDIPHMGSAYTTIAADVVARYHALRGRSVLLVTGTDEHGQKIQRTAASRGKTPQAHCDELVTSFKDLWDKLNIRCDRFIRTSDLRHQAIVNDFFQRVYDNGDIYLGQQQGWYCVACEEFKEERDLLEDHVCAIHKRPTEWRDESNYFFRLSRYQEALETLYAQQPDFIQPNYRRNEVLSFVSQGLQDFSISRVNLDWGFPFPIDPTHTFYVWMDALVGYLTALLEPEQEPTLDNALSRWWPMQLHLIGKDILRFHAVYWPAMLMSARLPLPKQVYGHGFLTKDGQKMGKSLGNTLDPVALVETYGSDAVRYFFMKEIEFGRDGDFNETRFIHILNADLANDLGNLLNRTLKMVQKYCQGQVPTCSAADFSEQHPLKQLGLTLPIEITQAYESLAFHMACTKILNLAQVGNKFIDEQAPWTLFKKGDQSGVEAILYAILESVRFAAYWLSPVIPTLSERIYQQLGFTTRIGTSREEAAWGFLPAGQSLPEPEPVFRRLELPAPKS